MKNLALYLAIAAIAAGCASKETKTDVPTTDRSAGVSQPAPTTGGSTTSRAQQPTIAGNPLRDPTNILSKRSVFFDYDSNVVKDEYRPLVTAHAQFLQKNPSFKMRVEGNADDRGSREYNLALGQRRADAIKNMMTLLGARSEQVETVSFGEEKPRCSDGAEGCWSQNRRGDIAYQGE